MVVVDKLHKTIIGVKESWTSNPVFRTVDYLSTTPLFTLLFKGLIMIKRCPSYPGYSVSDEGDVYGHFTKEGPNSHVDWTQLRKRRSKTNKLGYRTISLSVNKKHRNTNVHRMVLDAFCGPKPEGMVTRHLDGVKTNNNLKNLKYGTSEENTQDAIRLGELRRGESINTAKLTERQVLEIRRMFSKGITQSQIARHFNVCRTSIRAIVHRKSWKHI